MGETRVDLLHLLEDLRDAYPGSLEETILTEIVANSLDSGAATVALATDPPAATLTILDDGTGMRRRELARFHDIAATTKTKGEGIGFAGVGIKLGLLACAEVTTETRRGRHHVATSWGLASRHRAPWRWIPPSGLVPSRGTAVRLRVQNVLSPLLDPGFIEVTLRRHFQPLLDPGFAEIMTASYPHGVRIILNGVPLAQEGWSAAETAPIAIRLARRRKPSAAGYLVRDRAPLPESRRGVGISTFGKVIKQGWDWLGITPAAPDRIAGLVEVPALAGCLTLNKADFIRAGTRGATYLAYRKAIQEAVSGQLAAWGDDLHEGGERARRAARPVERDLEAVVEDLAAAFPLLAALVDQRAGGQRRLPMGRPGVPPGDALAGDLLVPHPVDDGDPLLPASPLSSPPDPATPADTTAPLEDPTRPPMSLPAPPTGDGVPPGTVRLPAARGPRRPGRYGLAIQFESRPDDPELARLVESTVWVNDAHPAYRRAAASRSEGYHIALSAALALAPLAVEPAKEHGFVTAFLTAWGEAIDRRRTRRRR